MKKNLWLTGGVASVTLSVGIIIGYFALPQRTRVDHEGGAATGRTTLFRGDAERLVLTRDESTYAEVQSSKAVTAPSSEKRAGFQTG